MVVKYKIVKNFVRRKINVSNQYNKNKKSPHMYPVSIFSLDRCLQGANNIKEDPVLKEKKQRGIAYRRYVRNKTIQRKKSISNAVYGLDWYKHNSQYSKGKIHCGCGLCKFGKKYGLPTIRDMREMTREKTLLDDYNMAQ